MNSNSTCLNGNKVVFILGLLVVFLMVQGCTGPLVKLENETFIGEDCAKTNAEGDGGIGACSERSWQNQSATNFWNMDTHKVITPAENLFCTAAGSKKCRKSGSSSSCFNAQGQPDYCYDTYTNSPNPNSCFCACGQL